MKIKLLFTLIIYLIFISLSLAQTFQLPITVADGINPTQDLNIGMDCSATDIFDTGLDVASPPTFPPPPSFGTRLELGIETYFTDIRHSTSNQTEFRIRYQADTGGTIVLSWDSTSISPLGTFTIVDRFTGSLFSIDMSTTDTFTPTDDGNGGAFAGEGINIFVTALPPGSTPGFDGADIAQSITADGLYSFNSTACGETSIDVEFNGVSNSGGISALSSSEQPVNPVGILGNVSQYRWEIQNSTLDVLAYSSAQIRINSIHIPNAGIGDISSVHIYHRTTIGSGNFSQISTSISGTELIADFPGTGEFALGSEDQDNPLPVELNSFNAHAGNNQVILKWTTESELENDAFILERCQDYINFEMLVEIKGQGSTSGNTDYSFTDKSVLNGFTYFYRLADRNINGKITYHTVVNATPNSKDITIENTGLIVDKYTLYNNYPNPFNPETTIKFGIPFNDGYLTHIKLMIYNSLGQIVTLLYDGLISDGQYTIKWNGKNEEGMLMPSGVFFIIFQSEQFVQTQKIILLR